MIKTIKTKNKIRYGVDVNQIIDEHGIPSSLFFQSLYQMFYLYNKKPKICYTKPLTIELNTLSHLLKLLGGEHYE